MVSRERIKKIILEELDQNVLELFCRLESNRVRNLTDILTDMRAVCGVTIVNMAMASRFVSEGREIAELNIKFKPFGVATNKYLRKLIADVKKIDGVLAFIIRKSKVMTADAAAQGEVVGIGEGTNN